MQYLETELRRGSPTDQALADVVAGVRKVRGKDIAFPDQSQAKKELPKTDLLQQAYETLSHLRQPTKQEKTAMEKRGFVFFPMERKSYAQDVAADPNYFLDGELDYANARPALQDFVPPVAAQIGLNPTHPALPEGFNKPRQRQLEMIETESQKLQQEFPDARLIMLPVTTYAQADYAYKEMTGKPLLPNFFARGIDTISGVRAAGVGRGGPAEPFRVDGWNADVGGPDVGAVPAVVFVRK